MSRIAERSTRVFAHSFSRIAALCACVATTGCALVEGTSSPTTDTRVMLGAREVVEVPRFREAARNYHCREGFLMCDAGGATQRCHCSTQGVVLLPTFP
jgi:hypothetical protein